MVHPYLQAPYQFPLLTVLAYLVLCRLLRFTWMYWKHAQYPYKDRASFAKMTMTDAQDIQWYLYQLEFPFTTQKALEFALFRTYGIPAVSKLLVQTKQLSDKKNAPKVVPTIRGRDFQISANIVAALRRHRCSYRRIYGKPT